MATTNKADFIQKGDTIMADLKKGDEIEFHDKSSNYWRKGTVVQPNYPKNGIHFCYVNTFNGLNSVEWGVSDEDILTVNGEIKG